MERGGSDDDDDDGTDDGTLIDVRHLGIELR